MFVDNLGTYHENVVFVPDGTVLEDAYKVRVLTQKSSGRYDVLGEELFPNYPTEDQLMWCIANFKGSQAVVEHVYWLTKLPFTEDDNPPAEMKRVMLTYSGVQSEIVTWGQAPLKILNALRDGDGVMVRRFDPDWEEPAND